MAEVYIITLRLIIRNQFWVSTVILVFYFKLITAYLKDFWYKRKALYFSDVKF